MEPKQITRIHASDQARAVNTSMETLMHSVAVRKESEGRRPTRRRLVSLGFGSAAFLMAALGPVVASGQMPPAPGKADPAGKDQPAKSEVKAATVDPSAV